MKKINFLLTFIALFSLCVSTYTYAASKSSALLSKTMTHSVHNTLKPTFATKNIYQDTIKVVGHVLDTTKVALQNVTVQIKGSTETLRTDSSGYYAIAGLSDQTIVFSLEGYETREFPFAGLSTFNLTLFKVGEAPKVEVAQVDSTNAATTTDSTQVATVGTDSTRVVTGQIDTANAGSITGLVVDDTGPIPGVTVTVQGTNQVISTDEQGKFAIKASPSAVLVFSSVGYSNVEESVGERKSINVTMVQATNTISSVDVVAVGYGTMSRATLASSVSSIGSDEIENEVLPSITQAIQGKAGGVQVTQKSGSPGGGLNIRVRGTTSINASSDPLYVVDGIPVNSTTNFTGGSNFNFGGGTQGINVLASINPADVQSVEILKDAASSSIYGSRAANGVVLITTRKGQAGTSSFNFNMYEGFSQVPKERYYDMMNTEQYQSYMQDYYKYWSESNPAGVVPEQIFSNPNVNTDWQDAIFRTAPTRSYELSASGGSEKTQYYTSIGYMQQGGVLLNSNFNRISARINLDHQHSEKLKFNTSINLTRAVNDRVQEENSKEGPTKGGIFMAPNIPVYDASGNYSYDMVSLTKENPVAMLELPTNNAETFRALANVSAEYKFIPTLALKTSFGADVSFIDETFFMPPNGIRSFASSGGIGLRRNTRDQLWINETTLTYDNTFGDHYFNALGGVSVQGSRLEFVDAARSNFSSNDIEYISAGGVITGANSFPEEWAIASAFARINYNYKSKYILTANYRTDGSSRFGENNRWASFPSFAAAWRVSEEDFLTDNSIISDLKIRASWGITGNQSIGNYARSTLYSSGQNYIGQPGFIPATLGNKDLKWETTNQSNIGLDLGLFNNRISILADYYYKKTSDLLLAVPIETSTGFVNQFTNSGDIENKGFEFELTTRNFVGEFKWSTSLNMTFNRNKVLALPNNQRILGGVGELNIAEVGLPLGTFYGWKMIGVNPQTGLIDFEDANGNPTAPTDQADRQVIGDPNPDFFGGITNTFEYKNVDLSIMGQFTYGNDVFNYNLATGLEGYSPSNNGLVDWVDRWRQPGDITSMPRPTPGSFDNGAISDRFVQDGSFFRLRNITLGYTFPEAFTQNIKVSKLRVYATVQNAFVFTKYKGYDPEVSSSHGGANTGLIYGYDYGSYPQPRIFTAGVNLSF
ncbi:SusC/RagA family TonB-linked outer membrane protein [Sphingobacterium hungaricum]